jgi:hypothetical protein
MEPDGFVTKSTAPSSKHRSVTSAPSLVRLLSISTGVGCSCIRRWSIVTPSMTGISTSSVMTSGLSCRAISSPSCPFFAAPTTSSSASCCSRSVIIRRINIESSTTSTRSFRIVSLR